jgi:hypothetical protein
MRHSSLAWAVAVLAVGVGLNAFRPAVGVAQPAAQTVPARYTVVETQGTNLLVVDNATNIMHYYTVDQGKEVGDDLKLRGSVDLTQVGQPVIKPKPFKPEK